MDLESRRRWRITPRRREVMLERSHIPKRRGGLVTAVDKKRAPPQFHRPSAEAVSLQTVQKAPVVLPERDTMSTTRVRVCPPRCWYLRSIDGGAPQGGAPQGGAPQGGGLQGAPSRRAPVQRAAQFAAPLASELTLGLPSTWISSFTSCLKQTYRRIDAEVGSVEVGVASAPQTSFLVMGFAALEESIINVRAS